MQHTKKKQKSKSKNKRNGLATPPKTTQKVNGKRTKRSKTVKRNIKSKE